MWNELETYKNHFLQKELKHMKAEPISKMVRKDFDVVNSRHDRCRIPFQNNCEKSTHFDDHAKLAYGWLALPKLMRELCNSDYVVKWRAINTLSEFLLNPLQAQKAIKEMDIVRKVNNCLLRMRRRIQHENFQEIRQLMKIVEILSSYFNGAKLFAERKYLLRELYTMIETEDTHMKSAMIILQNMTEKPKVCLILLEETDCLNHLYKIFNQDIMKPHYPAGLWAHFGHLLEIAPDRANAIGFFPIFVKRIKCRVYAFHRDTMKIFAMLLRCPDGLKFFDNYDCVKMLYESFLLKLDTFEFVMLALLHGLQSKRALKRSRVFTQLPEIVFKCTNDTKNERLQLYGLQTIRQLGEMPSIKRQIRGFALNLRQLVPLNSTTECLRNDIIEWLRFDKCLLHLRTFRPRPKPTCA